MESFLQTDAAVNQGNSGGALVDIYGNLVGINTAIASRSGGYEGYSFAVPSNIASKVSSDLIEYGAVQRALLGVFIQELNPEVCERLKLTKTLEEFTSVDILVIVQLKKMVLKKVMLCKK